MVVPDCRHDERIVPKEPQGVGNVAGASAELAPHVGHQKGDIKNVELVRQYVVTESIPEHHDGVVGNRTADQRAHHVPEYGGGL